MKCKVLSVEKEFGNCDKKAKFYIVDLECGNESGDYEFFWICEECTPHFIGENGDDPHYIIIKEHSLGVKRNG